MSLANIQDLVKQKLNNQQYSTVNKTNITTVQYSTIKAKEIFNQLNDVIPNDGYYPFYLSHLNRLGYDRFIELVNKARASSETPQRLFCWFLKNDDQIR